MAQPSTETKRIRRKATLLFEAMQAIDEIDSLYNNLGGEAFFQEYLEDELGFPTTDITLAEFTTAMATFGNMSTWLDTQWSKLFKLLI